MAAPPDRRAVALALAGLSSLAATPGFAQSTTRSQTRTAGSIHDFDFFVGSWTVHHRRLKKRLAANDDWEEFEGSTACQSLLGGMVNLNESVAQRAGGVTRGLGLRAFDARTGVWADWSLSGGDPLNLGEPGLGRFENGVGTFLSNEVFEGRPIKVRGQFRSLSPDLAQWEQAFSPDGGVTWETNWVMRYSRRA
jgi:hypothetical protein